MSKSIVQRVYDALELEARIAEAREELAAGEDLAADAILRDLEDDAVKLRHRFDEASDAGW